MSAIDKHIEELIFRKLQTKARSRAASLRKEARGYWHSNRERYHELKMRGEKFNDFADMVGEMVNDLPAYPAKSNVVDPAGELAP